MAKLERFFLPRRPAPLPGKDKPIYSGTKSIHDDLVWNWSQASDMEYDETLQEFSFGEYKLHTEIVDFQKVSTFSKRSVSDSTWLKEGIFNGQSSSGGLRLPFQKPDEPGIIPFPKALSQEINKHFNLPAVNTHRSSKISGTHGRFTMRGENPGECRHLSH
jgi:hypothetical protein